MSRENKVVLIGGPHKTEWVFNYPPDLTEVTVSKVLIKPDGSEGERSFVGFYVDTGDLDDQGRRIFKMEEQR
jgi:hypothetical protein